MFLKIFSAFVLGLTIFTVTPAVVSAQDINEPEILQFDENGIPQYDAPVDDSPPHIEYYRATVLEIVDEKNADDPYLTALEQFSQEAKIKLLNGPDKGVEMTLSYTPGSIGSNNQQNLQAGETILVAKSDETGAETYYIYDHYRINAVVWLAVGFFALVVLVSGWKGLRSLAGLGFTLAVIIWFILPRIINGGNPFSAFLIGGLLIALVSIYLGHGFNRRTSIAVISTVTALMLSIGLALLAVSWAKLFGLGTEEAFYLQIGELGTVNLRGLLLGGIIIGILGVLDDVTTAQAAAIEEIQRANPSLNFYELLRRGFSVGHEHVVSMVNTLALAYVGASFPLLLLFSQNSIPFFVVLNSERVVEEIVRTLVGSSALVLAVPITTYLAAFYFARYGSGSQNKTIKA